jgi:ATP-dependent DNA helicase RecQ
MPDPLHVKALTLVRHALAKPTADFRPGQWEAIHAVVTGRARTLVVQRTGWGKSLVYFLSTRLLRDQGAGTRSSIPPLQALMRADRPEPLSRKRLCARTCERSRG